MTNVPFPSDKPYFVEKYRDTDGVWHHVYEGPYGRYYYREDKNGGLHHEENPPPPAPPWWFDTTDKHTPDLPDHPTKMEALDRLKVEKAEDAPDVSGLNTDLNTKKEIWDKVKINSIASEPEAAQNPLPPQDPPGEPSSSGGEPTLPGPAVPEEMMSYEDFLPLWPMVKDPVTGEWHNSESGEIPGVGTGRGEEGQLLPTEEPSVGQALSAESPEPMQTLEHATQLDPSAGVQRSPEPPNVEPARSVGYYDENGAWHQRDEPVEQTPFLPHIEVENERPDTISVEYHQPSKTIGEFLDRYYRPSEPPDGVGAREHLPDHFDLDKNIPPLIEEPALPAPGPGPLQTLDAALLDPSVPGPTLFPDLFDPTAPGPTIDAALLDPSAPGPTLDPNLLDPSAPGETIDPALLDPASPGPTLDPAQLEHGIVKPGFEVADPAGLTEQPGFAEEPSPTTPGQNLDDALSM